MENHPRAILHGAGPDCEKLPVPISELRRTPDKIRNPKSETNSNHQNPHPKVAVPALKSGFRVLGLFRISGFGWQCRNGRLSLRERTPFRGAKGDTSLPAAPNWPGGASG